MSEPMNDQEKQGCVILTFSGCSSMIGFILGMAAVIVWQAW